MSFLIRILDQCIELITSFQRLLRNIQQVDNLQQHMFTYIVHYYYYYKSELRSRKAENTNIFVAISIAICIWLPTDKLQYLKSPQHKTFDDKCDLLNYKHKSVFYDYSLNTHFSTHYLKKSIQFFFSQLFNIFLLG